MLEFRNPAAMEASLASDLKAILKDLRRGHVSRFPVFVEAAVSGEAVRFTDSRISFGGRWNWRESLAMLHKERDAKGRTQYVITSRLITNEKFSSHSEGYRQKKSIKAAPIAGLLKTSARPYSPQEIETFSGHDIRDERLAWVEEPYNTTRALARIDPRDVIKEVTTLASMGVEFTTESFRKLVAEGLALQDEVRRRKDMEVVDVHVFIQPDNSVVMTQETRPWPIGQGGDSTIYSSLEAAPESVQAAVALLRITAQPGKYIPETGRMLSENIFRIHVPANDYSVGNA